MVACVALAVCTDRVVSDPEADALPELLPPAHFEPHARFERTDRAGTLLRATLKRPPELEQEEFAADMHAVAGLAEAAGYETLVVVAPDGRTLVSGSVEAPTVQPLDRPGT